MKQIILISLMLLSFAFAQTNKRIIDSIKREMSVKEELLRLSYLKPETSKIMWVNYLSDTSKVTRKKNVQAYHAYMVTRGKDTTWLTWQFLPFPKDSWVWPIKK